MYRRDLSVIAAAVAVVLQPLYVLAKSPFVGWKPARDFPRTPQALQRYLEQIADVTAEGGE